MKKTKKGIKNNVIFISLIVFIIQGILTYLFTNTKRFSLQAYIMNVAVAYSIYLFYITRKINELLVDKAVSSFQLPNLQPIGELETNKDPNKKDIGSYEIKRSQNGLLNSQKEPVYRYIPTTQDEEVKEINYDYESRRGPKRLQIPKLQQRNRTTTAQREVRNNPFNKRQGGHRLNVML